MDFNFDEVAARFAGVLGAAVSIRFIPGSWVERLTLAAGGAALSYFASPFLAHKTGMPEGFTGFLLGLFGMAIASKVWELIQASPVGAFWSIALEWLKKFARV